MSQHSNSKLLDVLADAPNYQPKAISAALSELKSRNVSGFDIEDALDEARERSAALERTRNVSMSNWEKSFWLLLPMITLSPFGIYKSNKYAKAGYQRKGRQLLEFGIMGLTMYLIFFLTVIPLVRMAFAG